MISFICAIAVNHQVGEVCIKGAFRVTVDVEVQYCVGTESAPHDT
jgi:hypothetical protein